MITEPLWRTVLCWTALVTFFALPFIVFVCQVLEHLPAPSELEWLGNVYKADVALVFGLAGLNSWDKRNGKMHPKKREATKREEADQ